uniref:Aurora kinase n=1 Tax=Dermatophagoides pteronyssinus TaxID=6956 RepID=A0A6P6YBX2_DERPT|nr:aurora kinase B-like [Dermatophagoides pteronyssinus]
MTENYKVPYYVNKRFESSYPHNSDARKKIEAEVDFAVYSAQCECNLKRLRRDLYFAQLTNNSLMGTLNDFDIGRKLGSGQFGSVYLARERRTGYIVAIKAIKKASLLNTGNEHLLRREIEIHSHLIHPNILGFFGWFITKTAICLIIEVAPKGELMDKLSLGGLREPIVSRYMFQMISAIRACHKMNVIHRDLKPENILIDLDGRLKLADFGWAAYLKNRRKTYCGTMDYLSPEIVRQEWYGKEVDIWCLGILCFELATGGPPFKTT